VDKMKKGQTLYVRIDHRVEGTEFGPTDFDDHVAYLSNVAKERYFVGGGFANTKGGMIIYSAKDMDEARSIADNDPIIQKNLYRYEMMEWEPLIISE